MRITVMAYSLSFLLVSVSVVVLCFTSRRSGGSEAAGPVLSQLESKINQLEDKFNSLSGRTCKDGKKGQDGDCGYICSKDHFLTYENTTARSGRMACCRDGEKVSPSGVCQNSEFPDFCYKLKGRLVNVRNSPGPFPLPTGQLIFLRGFEAEFNGNTVRCDNNCCCSLEVFFQSFCGLEVSPNTGIWNSILGLKNSCITLRVVGGLNSQKVHFTLANPGPPFWPYV